MKGQTNKNKHVVTIGNGTGQGIILRCLKELPYSLTAIVGITDNGGHSGYIRQHMGIPSPGDLRNCLVSLADPNIYLSKLLTYRFTEGELDGISLGNLIIAALLRIEGCLSLASARLGELLGLDHEVIPVSDESTQICAQLIDGSILIGEWEIIERKARDIEIKELFLERPIQPVPRCLTAIREADYVIITPGSLRTGIISILLVPGIKEALLESSAKKIYICNLVTQPGQTDNFSLSQHLDELYRYLPSPMDFVIANDPSQIKNEILQLAAEQGSAPVKIDPPNYTTKLLIGNLIKDIAINEIRSRQEGYQKRFRSSSHLIVHDPEKLRPILSQIINSQEVV